jgi:hypothetical protein
MQLFRRKIVCIAQNIYAPFSKKRREIFTIKKGTDRRQFHLRRALATVVNINENFFNMNTWV